MINVYYVYVYLDPRRPGVYKYDSLEFEFEPFYVGKGKLNRITDHLNESRINFESNNFKKNKINKIIKSGFYPIYLKIKSNISEEESFEIEKSLIDRIGRYNLNKGPLSNLTNGGEGMSGLIKTETHRKNLSISSFGKKMSDKSKKKISESLIGKPGRNTGNKHSIETKNKISRSKMGQIPWNAVPILQMLKNGDIIKEWRSARQASEHLNLSQGNIWMVLHGKRKSCGGFLWKIKL